MVLPGHISAGYLVTSAILNNSGFSGSEYLILCLIGTLSGVGPDLDLIWFSLVHKLGIKKDHSHRDYVSHAPSVWLFGSVILFSFGLFLNSEFIKYMAAVILAGSWSHFLLDSIEFGIMWLWPLSKRRYALRYVADEETGERPGSIRHYWKFATRIYTKRISFYCELVLTAVGIVFAIYQFFL